MWPIRALRKIKYQDKISQVQLRSGPFKQRMQSCKDKGQMGRSSLDREKHEHQCKFIDTMLRVGPLCWLMVCFQAGGKSSLPPAAVLSEAGMAGEAMCSGYLQIGSRPHGVQKLEKWHERFSRIARAAASRLLLRQAPLYSTAHFTEFGS